MTRALPVLWGVLVCSAAISKICASMRTWLSHPNKATKWPPNMREAVACSTLQVDPPFSKALPRCDNYPRGTWLLAGAGVGAKSAHAVLQGVSAVAVTSGANMNFDRLRLVTELAGIGALKEAMLATTMPERQGSFKDFIDIALDNPGLQITEFKYRCGSSPRTKSQILLFGKLSSVPRQLRPPTEAPAEHAAGST